MQRAALYVRYSSDKQQEISIEGQIRVCKEYCAREGYEVAAVYADRAVSASKNVERRDEFQRMIRDSAKRPWDVVVVYKFSRFARNRYDSAVYKAKLRQRGIRVLSACEPISDNPEGALIEGIFESLDEFYSKSLAQDVSRGMYENASKGLSTGGTIPLGYTSVNKALQIDPITAPIVRLIFEQYASGVSRDRIAQELNEKGYRTRTGNPFNRSSFNAILKNKKYIGTYHYNEEIELPDQIPALIDAPLFEAVQRRFAQHKNAPSAGKGTVDYMLTTRLFCGECGRPMAGESCLKNKTTRYHYYACSGKKRGLGCKASNLKKDMLENIVVQHARAFLTPENVLLVARAATEEYTRLCDDNSAAKSLDTQLRDTERAINNLLKLVEQGGASASLAARLNALEEQKASLACELAEETKGLPALSELDIVHWLGTFSDQGVRKDAEYASSIIDMLVNSVKVYKNPNHDGFRLLIAYNLTGASEVVSAGSDLQCLVHH